MDKELRKRIKSANSRRIAARERQMKLRHVLKELAECTKHIKMSKLERKKAGNTGDFLVDIEQERELDETELTAEEQEEFEQRMAAEQEEVLGALDKQHEGLSQAETAALTAGLTSVAGVFAAFPILGSAIKIPWFRRLLVKQIGGTICGVCTASSLFGEDQLRENTEASRHYRDLNSAINADLERRNKEIADLERTIKEQGKKATEEQEQRLAEATIRRKQLRAEEDNGHDVVMRRLGEMLDEVEKGPAGSGASVPMQLTVQALYSAGYLKHLQTGMTSPAALLQNAFQVIRRMQLLISGVSGDVNFAGMRFEGLELEGTVEGMMEKIEKHFLAKQEANAAATTDELRKKLKEKYAREAAELRQRMQRTMEQQIQVREDKVRLANQKAEEDLQRAAKDHHRQLEELQRANQLAERSREQREQQEKREKELQDKMKALVEASSEREREAEKRMNEKLEAMRKRYEDDMRQRQDREREYLRKQQELELKKALQASDAEKEKIAAQAEALRQKLLEQQNAFEEGQAQLQQQIEAQQREAENARREREAAERRALQDEKNAQAAELRKQLAEAEKARRKLEERMLQERQAQARLDPYNPLYNPAEGNRLARNLVGEENWVNADEHAPPASAPAQGPQFAAEQLRGRADFWDNVHNQADQQERLNAMGFVPMLQDNVRYSDDGDVEMAF